MFANSPSRQPTARRCAESCKAVGGLLCVACAVSDMGVWAVLLLRGLCVWALLYVCAAALCAVLWAVGWDYVLWRCVLCYRAAFLCSCRELLCWSSLLRDSACAVGKFLAICSAVLIARWFVLFRLFAR